MSNGARRAIGIIWLLLGIGGVALVLLAAIRAELWLSEHLLSGAILLAVAIGAIAGGLGLLRHWARARLVLRTVALVAILYGLLFQVMVGRGFGLAWFVATIALILFSAATLWKLHHGPHRR